MNRLNRIEGGSKKYQPTRGLLDIRLHQLFALIGAAIRLFRRNAQCSMSLLMPARSNAFRKI